MFLIGLVGPNGSASITLHFSQPGPRTLRVFRVSQFGGKSETLLTGIPKKDEKKRWKNQESNAPFCRILIVFKRFCPSAFFSPEFGQYHFISEARLCCALAR
jgi:hypothetical protein